MTWGLRAIARALVVALVCSALVQIESVSSLRGSLPPSSAAAAVPLGETARVSATASGLEASGSQPFVSGSGRFLAFVSSSSNLVAGDTNAAADVFVKDLETGAVVLGSATASSGFPNASSSEPTMTYDGRFLAFVSSASNIVGGDTNGRKDVFVRDMWTGVTERASLGQDGGEGNGDSATPSISDDGSRVAFGSRASNLISGDRNGDGRDVFVRDRWAGVTTLVSKETSTTQCCNGSTNIFYPQFFEANSTRQAISGSGRYVAFDGVWGGGALHTDPCTRTNRKPEAFLHDLDTGETTRASGGDLGCYTHTISGGVHNLPSISGDGSTVVYVTKNRQMRFWPIGGTGNSVVLTADGSQPNAPVADPVVSRAGTRVAFASTASNLVGGDTNGLRDVFYADRLVSTGSQRASLTASSGEIMTSGSAEPGVVGDGSQVLFSTSASDVVADDTNGATDVFARGVPNPPEQNPPVGGDVITEERLGGNNPGEKNSKCFSRSAGDPVDVVSGNFMETFTDFVVPGRGVPLVFSRSYNSAVADVDGPLGYGWTHAWNVSLEDDSGAVTIHQENGSQVTFAESSGSYEAAPRVTSSLVREADGSWTFTRNHLDVLRFDSAGRLTAREDLNGYATTLSYDGSGDLVSVTDAAGRSLSFTWVGSHITAVSDPSVPVRTVSFAYDGSGNLETVTDVGGGVATFGYDAAHRITTVRSPRFDGDTTTSPTPVVANTYDAAGRVASQTDPVGSTTTFDYTTVPDATVVTDPSGDQTLYRHAYGVVTEEIFGWGTADAVKWSHVYDPATLGCTKRTDPNGKVTTTSYDSDGNPLSRTDPLGRSTTFTYNSLGLPTSVTDADGVTTTLTYDSAGNLLSRSTPLLDGGGSTIATQTVTFTYGDPVHPGDVTTVTDPVGEVWSYTYDGDGNLTSMLDPLSHTETYGYNGVGWLTSVVSANGSEAGAAASDFETTFEHDVFGRVTAGVDPLGDRSERSFDANGNLVSTTDANGNTTTFGYDPADRLTTEGRADGTTLTTMFTDDGLVAARGDGAGNLTTYTYDSLDRPVAVTDPLSRTTSYGFDPAGNIVSRQEHLGDCSAMPAVRCVMYSYDAANQLIGVDYSDPDTADLTLSYDELGRRVSMIDGTGTSSWEFDSLGRPTTVASGDGASVGYGWDLAGRATSIVYPGGLGTVLRGYDPAGRLTSVADWLGNTSTFGYDAEGNLLDSDYGNDTSATVERDRLGRIAAISHTDTSTPAAVLGSFDYTRDPVGQVTAVDGTGVPEPDHGYDYDALLRLAGYDADTFAYDPADNLTQLADGTVQAFDAANQLTDVQQPITVVGTAKVFNATSNRVTLTLPAGVRADDQIVVVATTPAGQSATRPSGYSLVTQTAVSEGGRVAVWRRTAAGNESNVTVDFSGLGTYVKTVMVAVYRGVDPTNPVADSGYASTGGDSGAVTVGSITGARHGTRLLMIEGAVGNLFPQTFTQPAGMNERVQHSNQVQITTAIGDQTLPDAGPTGSRTATYSGNARLIGILVALNPQRTTYSYDQRGNRRTRTDPHGVITTYLHDQADRLTAVDGDVAYRYDGDGLRVASIDSAGAERGFVWDRAGGLPLMLTETPTGGGGPDFAQASAYVYGPGGQVLNRIDPRPDIELVGTDTAATTGTTATLRLDVPGGVGAGDQILVSATYPNNTTPDTPAGYTIVGTWSGPSSKLRLYRRTATGGERTVTIGFDQTLTAKAAAVAVYRGVDPNDPIVAFDAGSAQGGTVVVPSLVAASDGDQLVVTAGATHLANPTAGTWTPPPAMTSRAHHAVPVVSITVADETIPPGPTGTRTFSYNPDGSIIATGIVLRRVATPQRWHHGDHLGSTRLLTSETGTVVGTTTHTPHGQPLATGGEQSHLGYTGQYTDPTTGLIYLRARWYDPTTGQFLTRDPLVGATQDPYGYALNNPVNATDPTGLCGFLGDGPCTPGGIIDDVSERLPDCPIGHNPNGSCRGSSGKLTISAEAVVILGGHIDLTIDVNDPTESTVGGGFGVGFGGGVSVGPANEPGSYSSSQCAGALFFNYCRGGGFSFGKWGPHFGATWSTSWTTVELKEWDDQWDIYGSRLLGLLGGIC